MNEKYRKYLKQGDIVYIYVPVCNERYSGVTHGKFVKGRCGEPWIDNMGISLYFSQRIRLHNEKHNAVLPRNVINVSLASPLVLAEKEFLDLRNNYSFQKKFFDEFPKTPSRMISIPQSEYDCWKQTKYELMSQIKSHHPSILDYTNVSVPSNQKTQKLQKPSKK